MLIALCEDDEIFAKKLAGDLYKYLKERNIEGKVLHFASGQVLLQYLEKGDALDLLFMDIDLGDSDGVELMKALRREDNKVTTIFMTSLRDRMADGYDVNAFHFLIKNSYQEKLPEVMNRYIREIYIGQELVVGNHGNKVKLRMQDLYYLDADKRNTSLHTKDSTYTETESIQNFAKNLPADLFIEVYHATYVNVDHIQRVDADTLLLDNEETLPVSRRKRKDLMNAIMRRMGKK